MNALETRRFVEKKLLAAPILMHLSPALATLVLTSLHLTFVQVCRGYHSVNCTGGECGQNNSSISSADGVGHSLEHTLSG